MIRNGEVKGRPLITFRDTQANIEALTDLVGGETAYATDTGEEGHYDAVGAAWVWGGGGGAVDSVNGQTGVVVIDAADVGADPAGSATTAENNAKSYADGLVVGLWDDRGNFDASVNAYPSSGGSGTAGAILKGDVWTISVAGTLPTGQVVEVGDIVRALIDTPGNTQANWAIQQNNIGYTAENSTNKSTDVNADQASNTKYPSVKAVYDWAVGLFSQIGHNHDYVPIKAKNTSGATANANDVGYINEAGEYKTTTTANFATSWCVVIVGGADNSDIYIAQRGRVTVNYTGTAPSAGHYLVTSTTAGLAQRSTVMRPEIFAVCLAAGSGGTVSVMLLTQSPKVDLYNPLNFWRNNAHSTTIFTGTINGAPTATNVPYTVSTGNEDIFAVLETTQLAKIMLYNVTRGTYRLITACNTGTNNMTSVSTADAWANGDTITALYQTINDTTAGQTYVGLDLSQQSEIPVLARSVILQGGISDTGGAGRTMLFHPNEAYSVPKVLTVQITQTTQQIAYHISMPLIDRILGMKTVATGAGTALTVIKLAGYYLAAP